LVLEASANTYIDFKNITANNYPFASTNTWQFLALSFFYVNPFNNKKVFNHTSISHNYFSQYIKSNKLANLMAS